MKKFLSLVMVCVLALTLAGCGCGKDAVPYSMGEITGNKYENSLLGIGIDFPENWELTSIEDIALANGVDSTLTADEIEKEFSKLDSATVMEAMDYETGNSFNIVIQKLSAFENLAVGVSSKSDDFMDQVVDEMMAAWPEEMAEIGLSVTNIKKTTLTLDGKEIEAVDIKGVYDDYDINMSIREIFVIKDGYLGVIAVSALQEADMEIITTYIHMI